MNQPFFTERWASWPGRVRGIFNLNDPRWGRGENRSSDESDDALPTAPERPAQPLSNERPRSSKPKGNSQPPDLDELWRDLNNRISGLFGGKNGGGRGSAGGGNFQPDMKNAGIGLGLITGIAVLIWLSTGFFIVQEGQQAVITQFGKYKNTVGAGFNWRFPYPVQRHELVFVTQIRSVDVGRDNIIKATG